MTWDLMVDLQKKVLNDLKPGGRVEDVAAFPDVDNLPIQGSTWLRLEEVVAVVADLKASTRLSFDRQIRTTVRMYQAATSRSVELAAEFDPAFVDIQGDGFFAIFHGERALRAGMCAAMALAVFSRDVLGPAFQGAWEGSGHLKTGLKIGMACGSVAVKRVGVRHSSAPVWAGKPVNWAFKCAGAANAHELVVTEPIFARVVHGNDYLDQLCLHRGHGSPFDGAWGEVAVTPLQGCTRCYRRKSPWCRDVAEEYCAAVLAGETDRRITMWDRVKLFF